MVPALAVVVALLILAYVSACAAVACNLGGTADWVAGRDLSRTIWRRNNSRRAWQRAGWVGLALGLVTAFVLLAEIVPRS